MRHSSARRHFFAVLPALLVLSLAGCAEEKQAAPDPSPTPIADLNTAAMQVPRIEFCRLVPAEAVREALSSEPASDAAYGNGDEESLPGVGKDVVHEIGCSWTGKAGDTARAWVFARPVDAAFAGTIVKASRKASGCRTVSGPAYGKPSTTQVCRRADGGQRVRHAGLFGQTWLSCELSSPGGSRADTATDTATDTGADLRTRADRWCVEVTNALNTAR